MKIKSYFGAYMKKLIVGLSITLFSTMAHAYVDPSSRNYNNLGNSGSQPTQRQMEKVINNYLDESLAKIKNDTEFLEKKCGAGFTDEKTRDVFNQCYKEQEPQLKSDTFKASTNLTLAFAKSNEENKENIKKEFLKVYEDEIRNLKEILVKAGIPPESFMQSMNDLFLGVVQDAYQVNYYLAEKTPPLQQKIETYYSSIVDGMNSIVF